MEDLLRFVHVIGATVLFGTGLGIAFFMVMANRTRDPAKIAHVAATVVVADMVVHRNRRHSPADHRRIACA